MADTEKLLMAAETKSAFRKKEMSEKKKKAEYNKIKLYEDCRDGILSMQDYTRLTYAYEKDSPCLKLKRAKKLT